MHHMIPLADAEALTSGVNPTGLTHESTEPLNYTADVVFRDTRIGMCYRFTTDYSTDESGVAVYGISSVLVDGVEHVQVEPVVRKTETVTRWVPIETVETAAAEEAEQS